MNQNANYKPNCQCHICGAKMYRTPKFLAAGRLPFCCRAHWREWNQQRDMSAARTPAAIAKRVQKILANPDRYRYAGGRYVEPGKGYMMVRCPPEFQEMARQNGYVLEHRLVMAQHLGRCLLRGEVVHHLNGNLQDNRPDNLRLYSSHQQHYSENHAQSIASENRRTHRTDWRHSRAK
jgi:hypothetical protein